MTARVKVKTERVVVSSLRPGDVIYFHHGPGLRIRGIKIEDDEVLVFTAGLVDGRHNSQASLHRGLIPCPHSVYFTRAIRGDQS